MRKSTELLAAAMERARDENPRGDLYRTLSPARLFAMLEQDVAELKLAYRFDNDVEDKLADVANYCGFLLHNRAEPPEAT